LLFRDGMFLALLLRPGDAVDIYPWNFSWLDPHYMSHRSENLKFYKTRKSYPRKWPWKPVSFFPMNNEHHLHIKKYRCPLNKPWKHVLPVRYEHHLHIKK
jgi:hypothetical protein